jgi:hypothetical protein
MPPSSKSGDLGGLEVEAGRANAEDDVGREGLLGMSGGGWAVSGVVVSGMG